MRTRLVEIKPDRVVVERTVLQALQMSFVEKKVTLPKISMHLKALEGKRDVI